MTTENRPSSRVIQIIGDPDDKMTSLCEDGSIWCYVRRDVGRYEWSCILEAPTQPKSALPELGWGKGLGSAKENHIGDYNQNPELLTKYL